MRVSPTLGVPLMLAAPVAGSLALVNATVKLLSVLPLCSSLTCTRME